jgi:hypothetical protein
VRGFYKGLSASYLGVTEGTIQWVLYERLKSMGKGNGGLSEWFGMLGSAGTAKCVASLITYPHEVRFILALDSLLELQTNVLVLTGHSDTTASTKNQWDCQIPRSTADT